MLIHRRGPASTQTNTAKTSESPTNCETGGLSIVDEDHRKQQGQHGARAHDLALFLQSSARNPVAPNSALPAKHLLASTFCKLPQEGARSKATCDACDIRRCINFF